MKDNKETHVPAILFIEDVIKTSKGLNSELKTYYGCDIDMAEDMEAAMERLRARRYDLILLDLRFPIAGQIADDAGQQLMLNLRSGGLSDLNRDTPYILMTAQDFAVHRLSERLDDEQRNLVMDGRLGVSGKLSALGRVADAVGEALGLQRRDLVQVARARQKS